jgi:hypothetical protein
MILKRRAMAKACGPPVTLTLPEALALRGKRQPDLHPDEPRPLLP